MSKGPDHLAHQRLVAMAQDRRRVAEKLPPMSGVTRERLLAEVERTRDGSAQLAEDSGLTASHAPKAWQGWLTWLGVAAAVGVLILVVRLSNPESQSPPRAVVASSKDDSSLTPPAVAESAGETEVVGSAPAQSPAPAEREVLSDATSLAAGSTLDAGGGGGTGEARDARKEFPGPTAAAPARGLDAVALPTSAAAPSLAAAGRSLLDAAHRIRRHYEAAIPPGNPPPFLRSFEVIHNGSLIRLIEPDGSAYTGRISRLPRRLGQAGPMEWSFEGRGVRRSLPGTVWIVGNFVGNAAASDSSAAPELLEAAINVTIQVDGTNVFELRAAPAGP
jgi:hypothetical protein